MVIGQRTRGPPFETLMRVLFLRARSYSVSYFKRRFRGISASSGAGLPAIDCVDRLFSSKRPPSLNTDTESTQPVTSCFKDNILIHTLLDCGPRDNHGQVLHPNRSPS